MVKSESKSNWNLIIHIPAYNSEKSLPELLLRLGKSVESLKKSGITTKQVIVIDDGSTDGTANVIRSATRDAEKKLQSNLPLALIQKKKNEGPVAAVLDGMKAALDFADKNGLTLANTIILRMDSDLEHQPEDIERVLDAVVSGAADVSVGYIHFDSRNGLLAPFFNEMVGLSESSLLGMGIPQFCPGFVAFRAHILKKVYPKLINASERFKKTFGIEMVTLDFVALAMAKLEFSSTIESVRLSPIENKWIKKIPLGKLWKYLDLHKKTMEFLKKYSISQE
ncbi:TPA: glycosyltransferase family 2 protein [Candidatus Micrarchaeota archaeon]|nr:glycosyltransferase family 2 protein [Candidatus Micrarchaeota archaeon]